MSLNQIVTELFERQALLGGSGLVALSGGPDSVCLAFVLRGLLERGALAKLVLAHLNHQLRGVESDEDEAFVGALARSWGLTFRTRRADVVTAARQDGANLEETARRLRYEWFAQVAREEGCAWVATGHSADDQAETILFRLLRGSGLQGLGGMAVRRTLADGLDLVRPLLDVRRASILAFLKEHQQDFRRDTSNEDRRFTRNWLRHELLPTLAERLHPSVSDVLCRLGEQAREVHEEVARAAALVLAEAELPRAGAMIVLEIATLAKASPYLRREVFRLIWEREGWPLAHMTFAAWKRLAELAAGQQVALDWPDGVRARRVGRVLQLTMSV